MQINAIDGFSEPLAGLHAALTASGVVGTWDWDIARREVRYDAGAARLLAGDAGLAAVPLRGSAAVSGVHPDDVDWLREEMAATLRAGGLVVGEYRVVVDGEIRWLLMRGRIYQDALGRPVRSHGLLIDITETREEACEETRGYVARTAPAAEDPFDRAAGLLIEAREAIGEAGAPPSLRLILDMALLEVGRAIARRSES